MAGKNLRVVWAVHRLEGHLVARLLARHEKEFIAKLRPVPARLVQILLGNVRRPNFGKAVFLAQLVRELRRFIPQDRTARCKEWQAHPHQWRHCVEVEFFAKLAVVALFGFFAHL